MFEEPAIAALFGKLMEKPHFVTVFSHVVLRHTPISEEFIDDLSNSLQLSAYEKQVLATEPWVYFSCHALSWEAFYPISRKWMQRSILSYLIKSRWQLDWPTRIVLGKDVLLKKSPEVSIYAFVTNIYIIFNHVLIIISPLCSVYICWYWLFFSLDWCVFKVSRERMQIVKVIPFFLS